MVGCSSFTQCNQGYDVGAGQKTKTCSSRPTSEDEASPLALLLLRAADDLPVGDHVERDGELLEDGHHVPVVLRAALHVRRAPRLLHLKSHLVTETLYKFQTDPSV